MARRRPRYSPDELEQDPLGVTLEQFVETEYSVALKEEREPPLPHVAVREAWKLIVRVADAIPRDRGRPVDPADRMAKLKRTDTDRIWRAAHHHAMNCWLDAVGGTRSAGPPRLPAAYLSSLVALVEQEGRTKVARRLGVSLDTLKKQLRAAKQRTKR